MPKTPKTIRIKPAMTDVGKGPQLTMIPYPTVVGGKRRVLQPKGDTVSLEGASGSYWQRRINEGTVVIDTAKPTAPAERKKGED